VSRYAVRPPEARRRPKVAAFTTAHTARILALEPDLVLAFSDLQAPLVAELVKAGCNVLCTNQRTLAGVSQAIRMIGGVLGAQGPAEDLISEFEGTLGSIAERNEGRSRRPRVFFEEWDDPLISGIGWVSEVVHICGGSDLFPELAGAQSAGERIVSGDDVVARDPEVIVASWCGKKARLERIRARDGWAKTSAVRNGHVYEVKSADILQPGPSLLHGARQLEEIIARVAEAPAN
jgi:iron complex transport system substrate-binding protein